MKQFLRIQLALALVFAMLTTTSCSDDDLANGGGGSTPTPADVNADEMKVRVTADMPTAVLSSFDENSMGAALVRRLNIKTNEVTSDTKMILIKGEDILSRPFTEWTQAAKIYLLGGYIAIEKPHDAHLVKMAEEISLKLELATLEILTGDDGSGFVVNVIPANNQSSGNAVNANAAQFRTRIANISNVAATRSGIGEADAVAEMVIFSRNGFYQCAPYGKNKITVGTKAGSGASQTITTPYCNRNSGLLADGAAKWINTKNGEQKSTKSRTRGEGGDAINEIMSASEEHTYQADLTSLVHHVINDCGLTFDVKPNAYTEIYRVWGVNNTETKRDYYLVEQNITIGMGGKQEGDARFDYNKTLYLGPYEEDEWIEDWYFEFYTEGIGDKGYNRFYGSWFDYGEFWMNLSGKGNIMVQEAIPHTDVNNMSKSVAVGTSSSQTSTIGATLGTIFGGGASGTASMSYSYGWTEGTSYTMTTTTNSKELKCVKNTDGTKVQWYYSCGADMMDRDDDEHPLAPDALTNDVDIQNRICWSVDNPEGAYTVDIYHVRTTAWLANDDDDDKVKGTCRADNSQEEGMKFTMLTPNRAKQRWYMDVTFPEIDDPDYAGVKTQLTTALQNQFPDIYQTSIELADQTMDSENTIRCVVNASKKLLQDPNAMQTLKEYGMTYRLSEFTIKWYTMEGSHGKYELKVPVK